MPLSINKKKILFLGGAYAQIPIIKEAKNKGWHVTTCDYLPENPGHKLADEYHNVSTTDKESVLALAKKIKPDFVVAYASDPAAPTAAYVSEKMGLPGNKYESVKLLSEKDLFRDFLRNNKFNTPSSITVTESCFDSDKLQKLKLPIIVKPTDSSGSKGVTKIESYDLINRAISQALVYSRNKRIIAEEFIECNGSQLHGDAFVYEGNVLFSYIGDHHYKNEINPFVPVSTTWPSAKKRSEIDFIISEVSRAIKLSGFKNGPINIEARISENGQVYLMEIGPRSGGNFVPQVIREGTGFCMVRATLDGLTGLKPTIDNTKMESVAYYVIHSAKDGALYSLEISSHLKQFIKQYHQYIKIGHRVSSFNGANAAIGILLLSFVNNEQMHETISRMDELVKVEVN